MPSDAEDSAASPPQSPEDHHERPSTAEANKPRRSTRERAPAPSREDTDDGLVHGKATTRAIEQVREAASRRAAKKAAAKQPPTAGEAPDPLHAGDELCTANSMGELTLLVDVVLISDPCALSGSYGPDLQHGLL
ncbi:hypothetical protein H4582DRAFT_2068418 [Lactarius indigo]|nr:hypothetical protein H4582DRAFT_2068418 [Lactarius indigo]